MTKINDGGPAFPVAENRRIADSLPWTAGMSQRDWLAGQALTGLLAFPGSVGGVGINKTPNVLTPIAYQYADAMLAARKSSDAD